VTLQPQSEVPVVSAPEVEVPGSLAVSPVLPLTGAVVSSVVLPVVGGSPVVVLVGVGSVAPPVTGSLVVLPVVLLVVVALPVSLLSAGPPVQVARRAGRSSTRRARICVWYLAPRPSARRRETTRYGWTVSVIIRPTSPSATS
jgi:hypothetical protein